MSKDVLLEIGHFMSHAHEYVLKGKALHSHHSHELQHGHRHQVLDRIEHISDKLEENQATSPNSSKKQISVDQIKLICNDLKTFSTHQPKLDLEFRYKMAIDQSYISNTSPPPQSLLF